MLVTDRGERGGRCSIWRRRRWQEASTPSICVTSSLSEEIPWRSSCGTCGHESAMRSPSWSMVAPRRACAMGAGFHLRERDIPPAAARALLALGCCREVGAFAGGSNCRYWGRLHPGRPCLPVAQQAGAGAARSGGVGRHRRCRAMPGAGDRRDHAGARGRGHAGGCAPGSRSSAPSSRRTIRVPPRRRCASPRSRAAHQEEERAMAEELGAEERPSDLEIVANGKTISVSAGATVHDFLVSKRMTDAMAIVERNGEIVPRGAYGETASGRRPPRGRARGRRGLDLRNMRKLVIRPRGSRGSRPAATSSPSQTPSPSVSATGHWCRGR